MDAQFHPARNAFPNAMIGAIVLLGSQTAAGCDQIAGSLPK